VVAKPHWQANLIAPFEGAVLRSRYGKELKRHRQELAEARQTYGPKWG